MKAASPLIQFFGAPLRVSRPTHAPPLLVYPQATAPGRASGGRIIGMEDMAIAKEIVDFSEWCGHPAHQHYWSEPHERWFCGAHDEEDDLPCRCRGGDVIAVAADWRP